ncbi:YqaJ viral recombinase family protein [Bosea sp. (in: a-proteobacteria)]|uniref:YqaJ viral recombinase family protein n=1 Tax=Bosea sp. (in: a-proteobacteria) TaxID=1871050 RepID=UPI001AD563C4|nr:YqaJ viral recombinase family protein [Bosea sp. (in: a-proteobacteria)]MBN9441135.1 YqaJ viral recombinase family protein [Bosea sp. (in: a-proteobacteria)]
MIERIPASDRATWLKLRERDVTASAAAALLGAHPFMTPFELWQLKAGKISEDPEISPAMERGTLLEPVAVKLLQSRRPDWTVKHNSGRDQVYWRDPERRIGATPDVLIDDDGVFGIVQIKSVEPMVFREKWLLDGKLGTPASWVVEPPLYVVIQALVEAKLTGAQAAYVAPLVVMHGLEMPLVPVPIHEGAWDRVVDEVSSFWASIAAGEEPEPDWRKDAALLNELGRTDNGREIDLTGDNMMPDLLERRLAAKDRIKADEAIVEECDGEIIAKLGEFERAHVPGWSLKRPTIKRKAYEVKASSYRRLDIKRL